DADAARGALLRPRRPAADDEAADRLAGGADHAKRRQFRVFEQSMAMRSVMRKSIFLLLAILLSAPAVRRGAEVHIRFSGVICHVFDGTHAPRAVAMRGGGTMLHHAVL